MSANRSFYGEPEDPRDIRLVKSLIEKTKEGKVPWVRSTNAVTAMLPGKLEVNFVAQSGILWGTDAGWQLFTVRELQNEILRVNAPTPLGVAFQRANPALLEAVGELFAAVNRASDAVIDRAIDSIKKL